MIFYNNIFASSYKYYSKFKREAPLFSSVCVVIVCQMSFFFLILAILKKLNIINLFSLFPSKFYFLPIFFSWLFLLFRYYTKNRAEEIVIAFNKKPTKERKMWGVLTLASFVIPLIVIAFLLKK